MGPFFLMYRKNIFLNGYTVYGIYAGEQTAAMAFSGVSKGGSEQFLRFPRIFILYRFCLCRAHRSLICIEKIFSKTAGYSFV